MIWNKYKQEIMMLEKENEMLIEKYQLLEQSFDQLQEINERLLKILEDGNTKVSE